MVAPLIRICFQKQRSTTKTGRQEEKKKNSVPFAVLLGITCGDTRDKQTFRGLPVFSVSARPIRETDGNIVVKAVVLFFERKLVSGERRGGSKP
jgi:hypothetical protein